MEKMLNNREPLLTTEAISKWLGVSTRTLCLWAECKEIPPLRWAANGDFVRVRWPTGYKAKTHQR